MDNLFKEVKKKAIKKFERAKESDVEFALLLGEIYENRQKYFPNSTYTEFKQFISVEFGYSRVWALEYIKSGKIYKYIEQYNEEQEQTLELPSRVTYLKRIPFDTQDDKENAILIWKKALEISDELLPTSKDVKVAIREFFRERSKFIL